MAVLQGIICHYFARLVGHLKNVLDNFFYITVAQNRKKNTRSERSFVGAKSANGFVFDALWAGSS